MSGHCEDTCVGVLQSLMWGVMAPSRLSQLDVNGQGRGAVPRRREPARAWAISDGHGLWGRLDMPQPCHAGIQRLPSQPRHGLCQLISRHGLCQLISRHLWMSWDDSDSAQPQARAPAAGLLMLPENLCPG